MVDLTGNHVVKAICPRCDGNGYIRLHDGAECDCGQCECQGEVILPADQCRMNVEGGIEARGKKSGECI
jgi:DnaJ-class molecular chaperone